MTESGCSSTNSPLSEADIVTAAKSGDTEAFSILYNKYKRRVYSVCQRIIDDREAAEDLTQEVFLQIFRKIDTYRGEAAFGTWVHSITKNIALMQLRKSRLRPLSLYEDSPSDEDRPEQEPPVAIVDTNLVGAIDRLSLVKAVSALSPGYRLIFTLHDINGLDHSEIADLLGCTVGNCKSQLHKARVRIREHLGTRTAPHSHLPRARGRSRSERRQLPRLPLSSLEQQMAIADIWDLAGELCEKHKRRIAAQNSQHSSGLEHPSIVSRG